MVASSANPRIVKCPTCGKDVEWRSESRWRPFCSQRCRQIDLGAWAAEEYRLPEQTKPMLGTDPDDD